MILTPRDVGMQELTVEEISSRMSSDNTESRRPFNREFGELMAKLLPKTRSRERLLSEREREEDVDLDHFKQCQRLRARFRARFTR
jgi:hypothetical protein